MLLPLLRLLFILLLLLLSTATAAVAVAAAIAIADTVPCKHQCATHVVQYSSRG
jgi:hypothetical protein